MGIKVMINQENPDGLKGHNERLVMQKEAHKFPKKNKFIGSGSHTYTVPTVSKSQQNSWDIEVMKKDCILYKPGCQIKNCSGCKRKKEEKTYKMLRKHMKRSDYWTMNIAFECPIRGVIHPINACFETCEHWGRKYQFDEDGTTVSILHCYADPYGERELHSGKPTRDN